MNTNDNTVDCPICFEAILEAPAAAGPAGAAPAAAGPAGAVPAAALAVAGQHAEDPSASVKCRGCKKAFHVRCIMPWLRPDGRETGACPTCRLQHPVIHGLGVTFFSSVRFFANQVGPMLPQLKTQILVNFDQEILARAMMEEAQSEHNRVDTDNWLGFMCYRASQVLRDAVIVAVQPYKHPGLSDGQVMKFCLSHWADVIVNQKEIRDIMNGKMSCLRHGRIHALCSELLNIHKRQFVSTVNRQAADDARADITNCSFKFTTYLHAYLKVLQLKSSRFIPDFIASVSTELSRNYCRMNEDNQFIRDFSVRSISTEEYVEIWRSSYNTFVSRERPQIAQLQARMKRAQFVLRRRAAVLIQSTGRRYLSIKERKRLMAIRRMANETASLMATLLLDLLHRRTDRIAEYFQTHNVLNTEQVPRRLQPFHAEWLKERGFIGAAVKLQAVARQNFKKPSQARRKLCISMASRCPMLNAAARQLQAVAKRNFKTPNLTRVNLRIVMRSKCPLHRARRLMLQTCPVHIAATVKLQAVARRNLKKAVSARNNLHQAMLSKCPSHSAAMQLQAAARRLLEIRRGLMRYLLELAMSKKHEAAERLQAAVRRLAPAGSSGSRKQGRDDPGDDSDRPARRQRL